MHMLAISFVLGCMMADATGRFGRFRYDRKIQIWPSLTSPDESAAACRIGERVLAIEQGEQKPLPGAVSREYHARRAAGRGAGLASPQASPPASEHSPSTRSLPSM